MNFKKLFLSMVVLFGITVLFSCENTTAEDDNLYEQQAIDKSEFHDRDT